MDGCAGLGVSNSKHKFLYFNGNKDNPLIFGNLIRNINKYDLKTLFSN